MIKKTRNHFASIIHSVSGVYLAETVRYDEFRRPFAMGIMAPKVLVKSFPFMMPSLGAFARISLAKDFKKRESDHDFVVAIESEKGEPAAIARARFTIGSGPSEFLFRVEFTPPRFESPGKYFLCLKDQETFEDIVDRVFVAEFILASDFGAD